MKTVIDLLASIDIQETLIIGNHSRRQSILPRDCFSITRSKKLPTRVMGLGSS